MTNGFYVYGLTRAGEDLDLGPIGLEHGGKPARVFTMRVDAIAAVVSELELAGDGDASSQGRLRPTRANMLPYHTVLSEVMKTTTIVPMKFGHAAASEEAVRNGVVKERSRIDELLDRVDGRVQMGLQVRWGVDNFFEQFVAMDAELRELRDEILAAGDSPSFEEQFALGKMFAERMAVHRDEQERRIVEGLGPCFREHRELAPRSEEMVADLAFLVDRDGVAAFTERLQRTAEGFPDEYVFACRGPLAPFDFVGPAA
jgi:hypothetical protein